MRKMGRLLATLTHVGIGTVRTRPCFPTRSTMHQRPSRCWMCLKRERRHFGTAGPPPGKTATMARSRRALSLEVSGAFRSA